MKTIASSWTLAVLALAVCADLALAQKKAAAKAVLTSRDVLRLLGQPIDLKQRKYREAHTLKKFLEFVRQDLPPGKRPLIVVDSDAFKEASPDAPDVHDTQIRFAAMGKVPLEQALLLAITKIPTGNAAMLVRRGRVEIGTTDRFATTQLLREPVMGLFEKQTAQEILDKLSDQTGTDTLVDASALEPMKTPVTLALRGADTLETALKKLAVLAHLEFVTDDDLLLLRARGKTDAQESFRFKNRRLDQALKEVAEATGKTIVIDPAVLDDIRLATEFFRQAGMGNFMGPGGFPNLDGMIGMVGAPPPAQSVAPPARYQYAVTGTFRKGTSVESMVRILASMVELQVLVLDDAIFVADEQGIRRLETELERKRFDKRLKE